MLKEMRFSEVEGVFGGGKDATCAASLLGGAVQGGLVGAGAGSALPGLGTAFGAFLGTYFGALSGAAAGGCFKGK
jgi:hypothetical protein